MISNLFVSALGLHHLPISGDRSASRDGVLMIFFLCFFSFFVSLNFLPFPSVKYYRIFSHNFVSFNLKKILPSVLISYNLQMRKMRLIVGKWFSSISWTHTWGARMRPRSGLQRSCFQIAPGGFVTLSDVTFVATYPLYFLDQHGSFFLSW